MSHHARSILLVAIASLACAAACVDPDSGVAPPDAHPGVDGGAEDDDADTGGGGSEDVDGVDAPVVIEGERLPALAGRAPSGVVAFRRLADGGSWQQVPVQVDERAVVDFGERPALTAPPGVTGTVYGTASVGLTALQYTDPDTFVGGDPDPAFDADDELVFMLADAGGRVAADEAEPAGVIAGSGVEVELVSPRTGDLRWIYLFENAGALEPGAGVDHVEYELVLLSGDYRSTYDRGNGPNPEASVVTTGHYQVRFVDRWMDADWRITTGGSIGDDLLDGLKARFSFETCGRSNVTFSGIDTPSQAEGAIIATVDGPVRAIRAVIGANSGTYTQRTNVFYRRRQDIVTDLRVHPIPGLVEHLDFSAAAIGMTYRSSEDPAGVVIDGVPDAMSAALPSWELVNGAQGSMMFTAAIETSFVLPGDDQGGVADQIFRDRLDSPIDQCWGDRHFLGAAGVQIAVDLPNTDPTRGAAETLRIRRVIQYGEELDLAQGAGAIARIWSEEVRAPVEIASRQLQPQ